ncbi:MAG: cellulase family glycosylhydrolase [Siphonobacter aquaeclarae]|nr:cellulase family glycosylhydrolase [Siphonobacter aquaeclarae]
MIPVLVWYGATGASNSADGLGKATDWWRSDDIKSLLLKYQNSIIINIANEPADETVSESSYTNASIQAIKAMRRAGFSCPFMIDAPNWGHDAAYFVHKGSALIDADPLHNLILSVHAYWTVNGGAGTYSDADITGFLANLAATGLPIVIGEVAWGLEQDGKDMTDYRNYDAINYRLILKLCGEKDLGYLVWQWGFISPAGSRNAGCMTTNGTFGGLTGPGREFAVTLPYSIKNTAIRAALN